MEDHKVHTEIGFTYRGWDGGHYVLERYDNKVGYFLRCIVAPPHLQVKSASRKVGDIIDISPAAIGRTYHRVDWNETPIIHVQPCVCYVCRPRDYKNFRY